MSFKMTPTRQVIVNANLFDSAIGTLLPHSTIVIKGQRVATVTQEPLQVDDGQRIDAEGKVVCRV